MGCLKGGASEIKTHYWFKGLDWDKLLAKGYTMPWVPNSDKGGGNSAGVLLSLNITTARVRICLPQVDHGKEDLPSLRRKLQAGMFTGSD